jgi:hypothetical protein
MTIDQWITEAECAASNAAHCLKREYPDPALAVAWAAVSQAAAATARAMMLDELRKSGDPRY